MLSIGYQFSHEYKLIEYIDQSTTSFIFGDKLDGVVMDRSRLYFQENKIYLESDIDKLGSFNIGLSLIKWQNSYDDYDGALSDLELKLENNQTNLNYKKTINGYDVVVSSNYSLMSQIPDYGANIEVSNTF